MTIDVMQTQPLGMCCGAFSAAMNVEMSEMPLEVRQQQVAMDYWVSLKGLSLCFMSWEHTQDNIASIGN